MGEKIVGPKLRKSCSPMRGAGAGEGNRTLVISLEGFCSTIELHPPDSKKGFTRNLRRCLAKPPPSRLWRHPTTGGGGWIRTNVGARPTDLQSAPFSRSGTPPAEPEIMSYFRCLVNGFAAISGPVAGFGLDRF